jgi:hypothetical protein
MLVVYKEGKRAFLILQEKISRERNDLSIFVWKTSEKGQRCHGVLTSSSAELLDCVKLELVDDCMFGPEFTLTNKDCASRWISCLGQTGRVSSS